MSPKIESVIESYLGVGLGSCKTMEKMFFNLKHYKSDHDYRSYDCLRKEKRDIKTLKNDREDDGMNESEENHPLKRKKEF
jgi:hypothetical protein